MQRVFLDTNILLEIILKRNYKESCQQILQAGMVNDVELCVSVLSFANMTYVLQKAKVPRNDIYSIERDLESIVTVLPMDRWQLHEALRQETKDFEDMLQYQCALSGQCDVIVTINIVDYRLFSTVPLYMPNDFLAYLLDGSASAEKDTNNPKLNN